MRGSHDKTRLKRSYCFYDSLEGILPSDGPNEFLSCLVEERAGPCGRRGLVERGVLHVRTGWEVLQSKDPPAAILIPEKHLQRLKTPKTYKRKWLQRQSTRSFRKRTMGCFRSRGGATENALSARQNSPFPTKQETQLTWSVSRRIERLKRRPSPSIDYQQ